LRLQGTVLFKTATITVAPARYPLLGAAASTMDSPTGEIIATQLVSVQRLASRERVATVCPWAFKRAALVTAAEARTTKRRRPVVRVEML